MSKSIEHVYRRGVGFTLIELLVVISIIALLISILLPALSAAKRRVKVLTCLSQLQQIGVGMATYVADDPGYSYPPPFAISGARVWDNEDPEGTVPDRRPMFRDIAAGRPQDLWFCPFIEEQYLPVYDGKDEWTRHFIRCYQVGYLIMFVFDVSGFTWEESGNPDTNGDGVPDGPYQPGYSDAAIVSDSNWYHPPQCQANPPLTVCGSVHSGARPPGGHTKFIDSNTLYGDGHAVTRNTLDYWATRGDGNLHMYLEVRCTSGFPA